MTEFGKPEFDNEFSFASINNDNNIVTDDQDDPKPVYVCQAEDDIIKNQSVQMLLLINIINAYKKDCSERDESFKIQKKNLEDKVIQFRRYMIIIIMIFFLFFIMLLIYLNKERLTVK